MALRIASFPLRPVRRRRLTLPAAAGTPRIAQVTLPEALFEKARYFAPRRASGLEEFSPQLVIGSATHLATLARAVHAGELKFPALRFAAYSIIGCRDTLLRPNARAELWQVLGVPVYEVLLDADNFPVATECEAREGWHIEDGVTFSNQAGQLWFRWKRSRRPQGTGLTGTIESAVCACGRPGKRVVDVDLDFRDPLRRQAV